ncbi:hypothetical protein M3Y98_00124800 [Aphelenchoides besseyi]|nr:hypothetical protein M3Y98_00124800 [Aphelenchoides besseyi]KAI6199547.1 hypothetical protein M3Y96_00638700 [Aphelenchoides besseyi]
MAFLTPLFISFGLISIVRTTQLATEDAKIRSLADILQLLMDRHPGLEIKVEFEDDVRQQTTTFSSTAKPTPSVASQPTLSFDEINRANENIVSKLIQNTNKLEDVLKWLNKLDSLIDKQLHQRELSFTTLLPSTNQSEFSYGEEEESVSRLLSVV